jgi:hypothetical protein
LNPAAGGIALPEELPDLLTVEEAARLTRVGRTKAYAMAREWRATGGRSGLPVVDLGHILRVPRRALEEMIGAKLTAATVRGEGGKATSDGGDSPARPAGNPPPTSTDQAQPANATRRPLSSRRRQGRKNATRDQLHLFESTD